jgi:hypothetical protein
MDGTELGLPEQAGGGGSVMPVHRSDAHGRLQDGLITGERFYLSEVGALEANGTEGSFRLW